MLPFHQMPLVYRVKNHMWDAQFEKTLCHFHLSREVMTAAKMQGVPVERAMNRFDSHQAVIVAGKLPNADRGSRAALRAVACTFQIGSGPVQMFQSDSGRSWHQTPPPANET
jgi:hypothetical protein